VKREEAPRAERVENFMIATLLRRDRDDLGV
jgi:hypothetical protein